jgi:lipopolysaccharide transport system permease protein
MLKIFTQHRYLLWQFTKRQIEQRHKGSLLGMLWNVLHPLIMMAIYTVVFGLIFKGSYQGVENQSTLDYALGIFLSLTIFQMLADVIVVSPMTILGQPNLVKKVVFPLEILPLANVAMSLYQFGIGLVITLIGVCTIGQGLSIHSILFLVAIIPVIPLAIGIAFLLSSLGVFLRDLQHLAPSLSLILMYSSAVFYSVKMIPDSIWIFVKYNPLLHIVEQARGTLLWHQPLDLKSVSYSLSFGLVILGIGLLSFKKLKSEFADII